MSGVDLSNSAIRARDSIPGTVLDDRYYVEDLLAYGGMGFVYRAYDSVRECTVAVKVLNAAAAMRPDTQRRFVNEARTLARIDSNNVVSITDIGELDDGSAYYVMEFLQGKTLDEYRVDTFEEVQNVALQILAGLSAAHAEGVVHRDLKPENIIVIETDDGAPICKLIDFGIAKLPFATLMTVPGQVLGTPAYIAPEQTKAGSPVDHRTDIYAFGVMLYELVTTMLPFDDYDPIAVALAHLSAPPPPVLEREPTCPPLLAELIMRCLKKSPDARYASAHQVAAELSALTLRGPIGAPLSETSPELRTEVLYDGDTQDMSHNVLVDRSQMKISVSDLLLTQKHPTPPGPQPWITPPAPDRDWIVWVAVAASFALAVTALVVALLL